MLNPMMVEELVQMEERKRDLLRSARIHQLYQQAEDDHAQLGDRFMTLIGDLMISGGQKLKAHSSTNTEYRTGAQSL